MPPVPPTSEMGRLHEEYAAKINGGTRSPGSGSQWTRPADGRSPHDAPLAFAWDCKSTKGKQIAVTLDMIRKIREQALGERPQIPLRWYGSDDLKTILEDWVTVPGTDWEEVLRCARAWTEIETCVGGMTPDNIQEHLREWGEAREAARVLADGMTLAKESHERELAVIASLRAELTARVQEIEALRARTDGGGIAVPQHMVSFVPKLPWTVIRMAEQTDRRGSAGDPAATVTDYDAGGGMRLYTAKTIRIQRSMANRPQAFVDEGRYRDADVYNADGKRIARVCDSDPSIEEG